MIKDKIRIALFEPRIPQNTGNISRTCTAFNCTLDLIKPLGFSIDDKYLKRAGLDYWKYAKINVHENFYSFLKTINNSRLIGLSKSGSKYIQNYSFRSNDIFIFGREDIGLPDNVRSRCNDICTIHMPSLQTHHNYKGVRSLNLSVSCGILIYEITRKNVIN